MNFTAMIPTLLAFFDYVQEICKGSSVTEHRAQSTCDLLNECISIIGVAGIRCKRSHGKSRGLEEWTPYPLEKSKDFVQIG